MKELKSCLLIVLIFLGYFGINAYADYTWDEKQIEEMGDDWLLVSTQANRIDPIHFYTLLRVPISSMGFIEKSSLKEVADKIYFVRELWVNKNSGERAKGEELQYLLDCNNYKTGWSKDGESVEENVNLDQIKWSDPKGSKYMTEDEIYNSNKEDCEAVERILGDRLKPNNN